MSSGLVMWAWFYAPSRLPHAYNKWITSAAAVDARLINALRLCRNNQLQYGKDLGPDARVLEGMSQDYAFLGTFITLFFYGVCLARTRVGPLILGTSVAARQTIDSGLCTAVGCGLCGWSILIERASRRKDIGLFVVPRALATMLPRRYPLDKQWRETLVFAASTAVVFTAIQENPKRVRGVMGEVLKTVLVP
ncbi:hypothetical protein HMPREF1624_08692 [Sporothrix schenckii ATCC 58251]|uniref:Integral membrane protein n=1 Tax=Sporothrix schenckii (strain ATCC 58251 / de Perez 2211183) TaxID=1391915 RepID=U7PKD1_SPOS1|nr:hypothetical protein HMPREF1624_08692 [Sporothrix schenckii ATCC 58251]